MSKVLVAYASKYGCAEKCAFFLQQKLAGEVDVINLQKQRINDISPYDTVIIGGSIYAGKIQGAVSNFTETFLTDLLGKKIGIYICCANKEKQEMQLKAAVPEDMYEHAKAKGFFGHEFNMEKMRLVDRTIIKSMLKIRESQFNISKESIDNFIIDLMR